VSHLQEPRWVKLIWGKGKNLTIGVDCLTVHGGVKSLEGKLDKRKGKYRKERPVGLKKRGKPGRGAFVPEKRKVPGCRGRISIDKGREDGMDKGKNRRK